MTSYIIRRLLWLVVVLFAVSVVTFVLMHSIKGGPWDRNPRNSATDQARLDARYGLDDPVLEQYGRFLGNALRGDLGVSFAHKTQDVREIIWEGFKVSAVLGIASLSVAMALGIPLGVLSAVKKNGFWDYLAVFVATVGSAVPSFVIGIFLIMLFAVQLGWLPTQGWGTPKEAILPVTVLCVLPMAYLARITRSSVLEVLHEDYVRTARAKGLSNQAVLIRHTMRNALLPLLTVLGPLVAVEITGSFIVESMFGIPGIGRQFITSVTQRDYGVIMGTTLFFAVLVAVANLVVDVAYAFADPRIRYQ